MSDAMSGGAPHSARPMEPRHNADVAYGQTVLPTGIRSRIIDNSNGLVMHVLEAGFYGEGRPCVLLLHGFPELAVSWRDVMLPLATAGYHVIAPDQRGYGRTTGWDGRYDGDVGSFRLTNLVRDAIGLVAALGCRSVAAVVGHDFGSPVAAWCALLRPDVFRAVILMSAPFAGPPLLPFDTAGDPPDGTGVSSRSCDTIHADLAALDPPRRHYQWYYSTREANDNMQHAAQGLLQFLRAYFHVKSADWPHNRPFPLECWTAVELAKLPRYYVMDLHQGMAETVAGEAPTADEIAACRWLPEAVLRVYGEEFARTGFQGGLQWYRCSTDPRFRPELETYSGRKIEVRACFIGGTSDWGVYQSPGALQTMAATACGDFRGVHLIDDAGHWVQQEQPAAVCTAIIEFLQMR